MDKFSILIPAYNESKNIVFAIKETINVLESLGSDYEVIIIDDGSDDNTYDAVSKELHIFNNKVKIEKYVPNKGKGFAIKYGFNFVTGDYILFLDADLDLHPEQVKNLIESMQKNDADVAIGSKLHKDSVVEYPLSRRVLSTGYYFLIKLLFGMPIKDTQTGLKLFKYKALENTISKVIIKRYAFDLEMLVILNKDGYKIIECPIYLKPTRKYGRIGIRDIFNIFWDTIAIFYRLHILKYYN